MRGRRSLPRKILDDLYRSSCCLIWPRTSKRAERQEWQRMMESLAGILRHGFQLAPVENAVNIRPFEASCMSNETYLLSRTMIQSLLSCNVQKLKIRLRFSFVLSVCPVLWQ